MKKIALVTILFTMTIAGVGFAGVVNNNKKPEIVCVDSYRYRIVTDGNDKRQYAKNENGDLIIYKDTNHNTMSSLKYFNENINMNIPANAKSVSSPEITALLNSKADSGPFIGCFTIIY